MSEERKKINEGAIVLMRGADEVARIVVRAGVHGDHGSCVALKALEYLSAEAARALAQWLTCAADEVDARDAGKPYVISKITS